MAFAAALTLAPACDDSADPEPNATAASETPPPPDSVREALHTMAVWRPLLSEVNRAELFAGGLLIDFGTGDQHKYTRGGFLTGWGDNHATKVEGHTVTAGDIIETSATLTVVTRGDPKELVMRVSSAVPEQRVTVSVDGKAVGDAAVPKTWATVRLALPAKILAPGRHHVELSFARSAPADTPVAAMDWMWLAAQAGKTAVVIPRGIPLRVGNRPRRALFSPGSRAYSFYLQVPEGAKLAFHYGAGKRTLFSVTAETIDGKIHRLFGTRAKAGAWQPAVIDLAPVAGKTVRLELRTEGSHGKAGWADPTLLVPKSSLPARRTLTRRPQNVIVIAIDTARFDAFGPFGGHDPFSGNAIAMPAYNALASTSTVFTTAYDAENWTKPSVTSMLSGLYPSTHTARTAKAMVPEDVRFISQDLHDAGLTTALFTANAVVSDTFAFNRGFDTFVNNSRGEAAARGDAMHLYQEATAWLDGHHDAPFFLWIQPVDPHTTYSVDQKYWSKYFDGTYSGYIGPTFEEPEQFALSRNASLAHDRDRAFIRALYYGEISSHDEFMGKFLDEVKKLGLYKNTLIVITNDHGEELGDHGRWGHGWTLYDELVRSPLIMHFPPVFPPGKKVSAVVETVDLSPTILDVLGKKPLADAEGMSFLSLVSGRPGHLRPYYAIVHGRGDGRAVRVGPWKLMDGDTRWHALYNIADDPREQHDRLGKVPLAERMCEVYLGEGLATLDKKQRQKDSAIRRRFSASEAKLDPEMRKKLDALGYL